MGTDKRGTKPPERQGPSKITEEQFALIEAFCHLYLETGLGIDQLPGMPKFEEMVTRLGCDHRDWVGNLPHPQETPDWRAVYIELSVLRKTGFIPPLSKHSTSVPLQRPMWTKYPIGEWRAFHLRIQAMLAKLGLHSHLEY